MPFAIRRVVYLYDVPTGARRAGHALETAHQLVLAVCGAFDVLLDDGASKRRFRLDRPQLGLLVTPLVWRELDRFAPGSVGLVLSSETFEQSGYLRDYQVFLAVVRGEG